MANYEGWARSNYFKVKSVSEFVEYCGRYNLEEMKEEETERVGFTANSEYGFDSTYQNEDGDDVEGDMNEELAALLADGEIAILMSVGHEKLRYVSGHAIAISSDGTVKIIRLGDIYDIAKTVTTRPDDITAAEY